VFATHALQTPVRDRSSQVPARRPLPISPASDPLESEADRIADSIQAKRAAGESDAEARAPGLVHEVLGSPGAPLDSDTRAFMEDRLQADFGHVRVHTDAKAAASARAIRAQAYTVGSHVVFGGGRFVPASQAGQRLLAHELVHVVQQSQAAGRIESVQRQADESDDSESESTEQDQGAPQQGKKNAPGCGNLQWLPWVGVSPDIGFLAVEGTSIASDGTLYMPTVNNLRIGTVAGPDQHEFMIDLPAGLFRGAARRRLTKSLTVTSVRSDSMICGNIVATQVDDGRTYSLRVCLCPVGEF
jgi:hypothetical protein